ncbi:MAG TPA: hypothetical protein VH500_03650 [Nitrososphaeraceae archaeon]|jgi:hypothetical protein
MVFHDPNMLNPFVLFGSHHSAVACLLTSAISASLAFTVSWSFYRSYRFSGLSYLIAIPIGFAFLGLSFIFEYFSLIYRFNEFLYPELFWIQLILQSNGLALIAVSYRFKVSYYNDILSVSEQEQCLNTDAQLGRHSSRVRLSNKIRKTITGGLFVGIILMTVIIPISDLTLSPYLDYAKLADLAVYMNIFNMVILGYILRNVVLSLAEKFNPKVVLTLASFVLLWMAEFFVLVTYYTYSSSYLFLSILTRLTGLFIFIYLIYYAKFYALKRIISKIETR